ncbi:glucosaminidase domain-containing protein, partial [Bacillus sp. CRN 9]|nr:glucosaminidase domain-containing protein [Bacillus sp. CRN 9]
FEKIKPDIKYQVVLNGDVGPNDETPVYKSPNSTSGTWKHYPWRSVLELREYTDGWYFINFQINGKWEKGYIEAKYVQKFITSDKEENVVTSKKNVTLFSRPSTLSVKLKTFPNQGAPLTVKKITDYWYETQVIVNGKSQKAYLDVNSFETEKIKPDIKYQVVLNGDVGPNKETPVYKSPNTSAGTWKNYPWRAVLELREYTDNWYFINFQINGKWEKGYIEAKYVQKFITSDKEEDVITSKKNVTLYSRPSTLSVNLQTFPNSGTPFKVKKITDYWYETQAVVDGKTQKAYLDVNSFEKIKPDTKYQIVLNGDLGPNDETPVYKSPNTSSGTWKKYPWRAVLELREYTDNWYFINFQINGKWEKGYIEAKYVQKFITSKTEETVVTSKNNVITYSRPSTLGVKLETYSKAGSVLKVNKITDYWYETKVKVNGKEEKGYLSSNQFKKIPVEYQTKSYNLTLNDAVNIQMRLTNPPPMTDLRLMSSNLLRNNDVDLSYNIGNGAPAALNIQPFSFNSATRDQVKQYMDPNNFKTTDISYYQFLKLGTPTQLNEKEVNDVILKGKGVLQGKAASFIQAGKNHSINEAYLISHALLETGNGQSNLATGVKIVVDSKNQFVRVANASDKNTKTVYNMYGIGAIDNNALVGGARTAWNNGWTSVDSAIIGGAKFVSNNYIHAGQDTLYKMRWNPNAMEKYGYATHQYASDIAWAVKQTTRMADMYAQLTKYKLVFEVPKYK